MRPFYYKSGLKMTLNLRIRGALKAWVVCSFSLKIILILINILKNCFKNKNSVKSLNYFPRGLPFQHWLRKGKKKKGKTASGTKLAGSATLVLNTILLFYNVQFVLTTPPPLSDRPCNWPPLRIELSGSVGFTNEVLPPLLNITLTIFAY